MYVLVTRRFRICSMVQNLVIEQFISCTPLFRMCSNNIDITMDEYQLIGPHFILASSHHQDIGQPFKELSGVTKDVVLNQVQPTDHCLSQA